MKGLVIGLLVVVALGGAVGAFGIAGGGDRTPVYLTIAGIMIGVSAIVLLIAAAVASASSRHRVVRLTDTGGYWPTWSPDGRKIAFASERDGNSEIYVMNADGSNVTRLTDAGGNFPAWSPDGRRIAFASGGGPDIYVMNADGSIVTRLTDAGALSRHGRRTDKGLRSPRIATATPIST